MKREIFGLNEELSDFILNNITFYGDEVAINKDISHKLANKIKDMDIYDIYYFIKGLYVILNWDKINIFEEKELKEYKIRR